MKYSNIDINLLPPELRPGPVVRYRVMINALMIIVTVAFLLLDAVIGVTRLGTLNANLEDREADLIRNRHIMVEHSRLKKVNDYVERTGRLISLASADYTDLPVVLHRVATVLPDRVFLERITNSRASRESTMTNVIISLVASRDDMGLVHETLSRFKNDPMLSNCFLRNALTEEAPMTDLLKATNINWSASGPDVDGNAMTKQIRFEIYSMVEAPLVDTSLATTHDDSRYLKTFERMLAESKEVDKETENEESAPGINNAPTGVTVKEVH